MSHLTLALLMLGMTSCSLPRKWWAAMKAKPKPVPAKPLELPQVASKAPELFDWWGEGLTGNPSVKIDLSDQKATLYRGGKPAGWSYVATGLPKHRTPTGRFSILEKKKDKHSNKYGVIVNREGSIIDSDAAVGRESIPAGGRFLGAPMDNWMRLSWNGIGMHKGPIPNPGSPASHGCIRLPGEMATILYDISSVGTPVTIVP